jgi:hypothetical protein
VVGELREDVTKTKKDGTRGRLRIDYGDQREPDAALKWLWRYVNGARTAGEIYGRALVVVAAEQHAARMVLPASQRTHRMHWGSHKDIAPKALKKLVGPHLPASLRALERAVERVHAEHRSAIEHMATASQPAADDEPTAPVLRPDGNSEAEPDDEADESIEAAEQE